MKLEVNHWPPSVNQMYRTYRGRMLLSKRGREFMSSALAELGYCHTTLTCRLAVTITVYPPDRRRRDLDNLLKGVLDLLTKGQVMVDDSQIDDLRIIRDTVHPGGKLEIEIWPIE